MKSSLINFIDKTFYADFENRWDDMLLRKKILQCVRPEFIILDVGAGRGRVEEMNFKGKVERVVGIDPDPRVVENPLLDEGFEGMADTMPFFSDGMFDLVFCDNVLEHVAYPDQFYKEIARVLKPGGLFVSKTPNKYYYVALIASITPHAFHAFVNRKRGRSSSDTFPTYYRANTPATQRKWSKKNGLEVIEMNRVEGRPEYLRIFSLTYLAGLFYERLVNMLGIGFLKAVIITVSRKG